jgi:hypothetical protein
MLPEVEGSFSLLLSFHAQLQYPTNDRPIFIPCSEILAATTRTYPCTVWTYSCIFLHIYCDRKIFCFSWLFKSVKPSGYYCTTCCNVLNLCILPTQCTSVFRMVLNNKYQLFSLNSINRLVFVLETWRVSCEVRIEFVCTICKNSVGEYRYYIFHNVITVKSLETYSLSGHGSLHGTIDAVIFMHVILPGRNDDRAKRNSILCGSYST